MLGGDPSRDSPFISTGLVSGQVADSTLGTGQEWGQCGPRGVGQGACRGSFRAGRLARAGCGKRPLESGCPRGTGPVRPRSRHPRDWEAVQAGGGTWAAGARLVRTGARLRLRRGCQSRRLPLTEGALPAERLALLARTTGCKTK